MRNIFKHGLYISWLIAIISMVVSLYFSDVLHYAPCVLCWYQRIAMYPLVVLLPIGIVLKDKNLPLYALPLGVIGTIIALYQNLLYYHVIPDKISPCVQGTSCLTQYINWFGFVSIPLLSLIAFAAITVLMVVAWKDKSNEQGT